MAYRNKVMTVYVLGLMMSVIDGTMVNVALPTLAREFGVPTTDIEWIAIGYLLSFAAVIPAAGWLGDRFGTKRMFVVALTIFVAMSLLCGVAQSLDQLVFFRILQGAGGGLVTPVGSTMLYRAFPMAERAKAAIGVLSVTVIAPAIGPMLGGLLVDEASWRWIFLINVPVGIVTVALAIVWLQETRHEDPGRLDLAGLVLSAAGVSILLYTLSIGPGKGWTSPTTLAFAFVGAACIAALIVVEQRVSHPILTFRLLRDRLFRTINIASAMMYAGFFGMIFVLPLYLQSLRGYSAFESGRRPVAPGVRRVPRGEPARPAVVSGDRTQAVAGRRDHTHRHRDVLLLPRRARHPVVDDRPPLAVSRPVVRAGVRVDPDRGVRDHVGRRHRAGDVDVQHATPDRLRRRRGRGGNRDRVEARRGRR